MTLNKVTFGTICLSCQFIISTFGASGFGYSEVESHCCFGFTPVINWCLFLCLCCGFTHMFCCMARWHHMGFIVFLNQIFFFFATSEGVTGLNGESVQKKSGEKGKKISAFAWRLSRTSLIHSAHLILFTLALSESRTEVSHRALTHTPCYFTPFWYVRSSDRPVVPSPLSPQSNHPSGQPPFCAFTLRPLCSLFWASSYHQKPQGPLLSSPLLSSPPLFSLSLILPFPLFRWKAGIEPAVAFQNLRPRLQCVWLFNTAGSH